MSATNNLKPKGDSQVSKNKENPKPSGSIITALMLVAVLVTVGGIIYHFFKKKKTKELKDVSD